MAAGSVHKGTREAPGTGGGSLVRGRRVLVVEDDLFFQEYVFDLLSREGAEVLRAQDGEEGLALATASRPDLVLLDVEIPRIQGFELLRSLRSQAETARLPVIMMSSKVEREVFDRHAQGRVRAEAYLIKPFSPEELFAAMRQALVPEGKAEKKAPRGGHAAASRPAEPPAPSSPDSPRVLVVDDSAHIRSMVGGFLREVGVEVLEAGDGKSGLARALETRPDAVILDVQMPHLNGFVVCELLKKDPSTRQIPVIIISAVADEETFRKHGKLKNRADAYLLKPFKKGDLVSLLGRLTGNKAFAPSRSQGKSGFVLPPAQDAPEPREPAAAPAAPVEEELFPPKEKALRKEIARLTAERDRVREEADKQAVAAEERRRDLTQKLSLALKRLEEDSARGGNWEEDVSRAQKAQAAAETARKEVEAEAARLQQLLRGFDGEKARLESELASSGGRAAKAEKASASHQQELAQAKKMAAIETSGRMEAESRLVSSQQEKAMLEKEAVALRERVAAAEGELAKAARKAAESEPLAMRLSEKEGALEKAEEAKSLLGKELAAERERFRLEEGRLREELARQKTGKDSREEGLSRERAELEKERDLLRDRTARMEKALEEAGRSREAIEAARRGDAEKAEREAAAAIAAVEKELAASRKEAGALQTEAAAARKALEESGRSREALEAARRGDAEKAERESAAKIAALEKELAASRKEAGALQTEAAAARKALEESGRSREALEAARRGEKEKADSLAKELKALRESGSKREKRESELEAVLADMERKAREASLKAEEGQAARGQLEGNLAEARKKLEETARAREGLERSLAETRKAGEDGTRFRDAQEKTLAALRKTLEEREKAGAALERSLAAATDRQKKLEGEADALRKALAAAGEKAGKLEPALREAEAKARSLSVDLEKEKAARGGAESAGKEFRKEADRLAAERDKRESALKTDLARTAKEKEETTRRLEEALAAGRKAAEQAKDAGEREHAAAAMLARTRGVLDAALQQAQTLLASPGGGRDGLEALVRSLHASLKKESEGAKGPGSPVRPAGGVARPLAGAGAAVALLLGVAGGYLLAPKLTAPRAAPAASEAGAADAGGGGAPIEDTPALMEYAKSWSRQTVEAPGEGIRIQATLHSLPEAELAIALVAQKNGWSPEKRAAALAEAREVLGSGDDLYATILVRDGAQAAPSASELVKRLAIKDPWGKMAPASEPSAFSKSRGVAKYLMEAARAPNPDYASATGVTVAFPRKGLRLEARQLQLVVSPTATEPGRLLNWDLSGWGG